MKITRKSISDTIVELDSVKREREALDKEKEQQDRLLAEQIYAALH